MREAVLGKIDFLLLVARQVRKELMSAPMPDPALESRADDLARLAPPVTRPLSDDERGRLAIEHAFLVQRERWLDDEEAALRRRYDELRRAIAEERSALRAEQTRIMNGLRFGLIEESAPVLDLTS